MDWGVGVGGVEIMAQFIKNIKKYKVTLGNKWRISCYRFSGMTAAHQR